MCGISHSRINPVKQGTVLHGLRVPEGAGSSCLIGGRMVRARYWGDILQEDSLSSAVMSLRCLRLSTSARFCWAVCFCPSHDISSATSNRGPLVYAETRRIPWVHLGLPIPPLRSISPQPAVWLHRSHKLLSFSGSPMHFFVTVNRWPFSFCCGNCRNKESMAIWI